MTLYILATKTTKRHVQYFFAFERNQTNLAAAKQRQYRVCESKLPSTLIQWIMGKLKLKVTNKQTN